MKPLNTMVYAITFGCTATALATSVSENHAVLIPVSVSFAVAASSFTAEWLPATNLTAGSIADGATLGHIQLSKSGTYAYRMENYTHADHPDQGSLFKDDGSASSIPVVIVADNGQKTIDPVDSNGIRGWTRHKNTISTLKLTLRNNASVSPGTYRGAVEVITISL